MVPAIRLTDRWIDRGNVSLFNKMFTEDKSDHQKTQRHLILLQGVSRKRYFRRKGLLFCEKKRIEGKMVWFGLC